MALSDMHMTVLEEAKAHLATYGATHTECCGTPLVRKLVAELERVQSALSLVNGWDTGTDATEQP